MISGVFCVIMEVVTLRDYRMFVCHHMVGHHSSCCECSGYKAGKLRVNEKTNHTQKQKITSFDKSG